MKKHNESINFSKIMGKNNQMNNLKLVAPGWLALFSPAVFLILLASAIIFAPKLVMFVVSAILVFFGLVFGFLAWKLMKLRSKLQDIRKSFKARVFVNNADSGFGTSFQDLMESFPDSESIIESDSMTAEDLRELLTEEESVTKIKSEDGKLIEVVNGKKIIFH